jgi:hypothetical protein
MAMERRASDGRRSRGTFGGTYIAAAERDPAPIPSHPEWCYCREASTCGNGEGG